MGNLMMDAISFEATIENGMIRIPSQYLAQLQPRLKVIVLPEKLEETEADIKPLVPRLEPGNEANPRLEPGNEAKVAQHRFVLPPDYRFKREEVYDRI